MDRTQLLFDVILDRSNGDILNIIQSARELTGTAYERLSKAYHEITGTDANPDEQIGLKGGD